MHVVLQEQKNLILVWRGGAKISRYFVFASNPPHTHTLCMNYERSLKEAMHKQIETRWIYLYVTLMIIDTNIYLWR